MASRYYPDGGEIDGTEEGRTEEGSKSSSTCKRAEKEVIPKIYRKVLLNKYSLMR
jgi:hypothetical protein